MPQVRLIDDAPTLLAAAQTFRQAMFGLPGGVTPQEQWVERYLEPQRVWGAWLEGELVGTTNSFSGELTLPGGQRVSHSAVTHVGVLPHFTRRGVMRALLSAQLHEFHQRGVAVATLRASQGTLYRRLGYGIASWLSSYHLDKRELLQLPAVPGQIQLRPAADAWAQQIAVVQRFPSWRAGTLSRWPQWWAMQQHRLTHSNLNHYVAFDVQHGEAQAFVRYHAQPDDNWLYSRDRTLVVDDLHAPDGDSYRRLIAFLLQLDITRHLHFPSRPVDDPLPLLVDNPRAVTVSAQRDESWLRIVDVQAVLQARTFATDDAVILDIRDPLLPHNQGRWRIAAQGITRSEAQPDATLSVDALASLILGGSRVWQLIYSQNIHIHRPHVAEHLERLFAVAEQPWSGLFF
ncbi:GNAT family N-acetyltransferase [Candidatus Pantoea floridensis]|uniref:Predicted acetyltransferase n=1 Tax=Candidatus Pantoea floridensis TaxID=1938870 RepID=A0A286BZA7_9GAMM|nr:GNAT family N-acetyltransferase [Pantoea floridensis]PIF21986.1 putative acetyltransferase [Enterobacteriaceae bacterium JKS000233]SOD39496.1 Predicted acetyltransferase [Pantoea floridensis]